MMQILFLLVTLFNGVAPSPVNWSTKAQKINDHEYNLIFTANIENGWNIYSQHMKGDDGPVKTSFTYEAPDRIQLIGKNEETGDIHKGIDEMFGIELIKIMKKGTFTQHIKLRDANVKQIKGSIEYMCCNSMQCLPPKQVPFTIDLSTAK